MEIPMKLVDPPGAVEPIGPPILPILTRSLPILLLIVLTFPSLTPWMMGPGLDYSWMIGLNQSAHQGLVYGREVVFTYGPLGFLAKPMDIGNNLAINVGFRLAIFALFWWACALHIRSCRRAWLGFLFAAAVGLSATNGELELVILVAATGFFLHSWLTENWRWGLPAASLTGLSLLVKFSGGIACCGVLAMWAALTLLQRPSFATLLRLGFVAATAAVTLLGLFSVFGGPPAALPLFLYRSAVTAGGYSAQMSVPGPWWELLLGLFQIALLAVVCIGAGLRDRRYLGMFLLLLPPLFTMFKGGYIRHDTHPWFFMNLMPVLAAFLLVRPRKAAERLAVATLVLAVLMMAMVYRVSVVQRPELLLPDGYEHLLSLRHWSTQRGQVKQSSDYFRAQQQLPPAMKARIGDRAVDAYPCDISVAVANGLNWKPRPIFQSYQAYVPALDELNARHYRVPDAPQFILYSHQSIDGQHPLQVDPLTWLEILRWYGIEDQAGEMLLLKRLPVARFGEPVEIGRGHVRLDERLEIPADPAGLLLLRVNFRLTALGRLKESLFKVYPPQLSVEYHSGSSTTFRLVWRNAASGILVSDLPQDLPHLQSLWRGGVGSPVRAIAFHARPEFHDTLDFTWLRIPHPGMGEETRAPEQVKESASNPLDVVAFQAAKRVLLKLATEADFHRIDPLHELVLQPGPKSLVMHCTGDDPYAVLPEITCPEGCDLVARCDVVSPSDSYLQLFYPLHSPGDYVPDQVVTEPLTAGHNIVYLRIAEHRLAGRIRIDPIAAPGDFVLNALEIRAVPAGK